MDVARYHRLRGTYYRLEGQRRGPCQAHQFPVRARCKACGGSQLTTVELSGKGRIFSFAEVGQPPAGFPGPYRVAMVELEEGPRVTAQLTDVEPGEGKIGDAVEMVTRRLRSLGPEGFLVYGYKFRPVLAEARS